MWLAQPCWLLCEGGLVWHCWLWGGVKVHDGGGGSVDCLGTLPAWVDGAVGCLIWHGLVIFSPCYIYTVVTLTVQVMVVSLVNL